MDLFNKQSSLTCIWKLFAERLQQDGTEHKCPLHILQRTKHRPACSTLPQLQQQRSCPINCTSLSGFPRSFLFSSLLFSLSFISCNFSTSLACSFRGIERKRSSSCIPVTEPFSLSFPMTRSCKPFCWPPGKCCMPCITSINAIDAIVSRSRPGKSKSKQPDFFSTFARSFCASLQPFWSSADQPDKSLCRTQDQKIPGSSAAKRSGSKTWMSPSSWPKVLAQFRSSLISLLVISLMRSCKISPSEPAIPGKRTSNKSSFSDCIRWSCPTARWIIKTPCLTASSLIAATSPGGLRLDISLVM